MLPHRRKNRRTTKLFDFADFLRRFIGRTCLSIQLLAIIFTNRISATNLLYEKTETFNHGLFMQLFYRN